MLPDPLFLTVHMYGVMVAVGILCAFIVLFWFNKIRKIETGFTDFIFYNGIASIVVGFGFAALFQSVYDFIENPEAGFRISGSITFIGGLIGGAACFLLIYFIFRKKFKTSLFEVLSSIPCSIIIAHAFGRVGCFFAGCCYGKETECFLGVKFPHLSTTVHPTQLYEATFLFILFAICVFLLFKWNFKHNLSVYLIAYGAFRFSLEYLRGDSRGELVGFISPSQFWSLLMIIIGIGLIFLVRYYFKTKEQSKEEINASECAKNEESGK